MRANKQKIFKELCIYHGVYPSAGGGNFCVGDHFYAKSLTDTYGMTIPELEKLVKFDQYMKTLAKAEELVHTAFTNNMKKGT